MNSELSAILAASDAPVAVKNQALLLALEIATPIAHQTASMLANGEFLKLLMELLKVLLPILLGLLKPV